MNTIKTLLLLVFILLTLYTKAQESSLQTKNTSNTVLINCAFGMGTFAAGENVGGSAFMGSSLSADWMPNTRTGITYGLETGFLAGEFEHKTIYGIPAIFRLGWHPRLSKNEKVDYFVLAKTGWGFGVWGEKIDKDTQPNGIVGGLIFGANYYLTTWLAVYTELGYTYYGMARSTNHPENPLGYGSGKIYASVGLSLKSAKH